MTNLPSSTSRVPAGVPTGGQFAASAHAESGVTLDQPAAAVSVEDLASRFRDEVETLDRRWREEADTERVFNNLILDLGQRVLDASEEDRPGYTKLAEAVACLEGDKQDDDHAEEVLFCLEDITDPTNMNVVGDGRAGHLRVADGKPAHTCPDCGNGYATGAVLTTHREQVCDGALDGEDAMMDDDAHDALHSAAETFASEINNSGLETQVAFLRRLGVPDEQIIDAFADYQPDAYDGALDDLVIDAASQFASDGYNAGYSDPAVVTNALETKRWLLSGDKILVDKRPTALEPGECTDVTIGADGGPITFRVSYSEWVPNGDSGARAEGYLRGEFSAESEWAQHIHPVATESSPFKADRPGDRSLAVGYAWDQFSWSLRDAATAAARVRRNDPVRDYIDDAEQARVNTANAVQAGR